MSVGSVKFFSVAKGFGFIKQDSGDDIFFHISEVQDGRELQEGDRVEFEIGQSKKGPCAVQVRLVQA